MGASSGRKVWTLPLLLYLAPPYKGALIFCVVQTGICLYAGLTNPYLDVKVTVLGFVVALIVSRSWWGALIFHFRYMRKYKESGELREMAMDFRNSHPFFRKKLRLGKKYIFAKRKLEIYAYKNTKYIFRRRKTLKLQMEGFAFCISTDLRDAELCDMTVRDKEEYLRAVDFITEKNPCIIKIPEVRD